MRPTKNELVLRRTIKFSKADLNSSSVFTEFSGNSDSIGGVIRKGQLGWLARGPLLEVFSLRNGNKISSYRFDITTSFKRCFITCVSEIEAPNLSYCLLAVGLQFGEDPGGMVVIYSVQESKILRSIETTDRVTCSTMISANVAERTILQIFQGCIAIGTDTGKIILLDINLRKCEQNLNAIRASDDNIFLAPCHVVMWNMDAEHITYHFRHSRRENIGFGIQLEVFDTPELVLSLLLMEPLLSLGAGLEDGRMILYDLRDLQAFHLAYPPDDLSPLAKLSYIEPPDDPRACVYIWAFHENRNAAVAVMHSVMYDRKTVDEDDDDGFYVYEGFQACSVRLTLPMFERESIPISCQSVVKATSPENDETISLCLLAWRSRKTSEILIFDVNQWYKEQMPHLGDWRDNLSYLASFPLKDSNLLDVWLDNRTIAPFNSIHRPEEHFFPISLSFDCIVFRESECVKVHWPGLQNRALSMLNMAGPSALLEPSVYYHEIAKASLISQSSPDYSFSSSVSLNVQRETLLSVALEYNCFGLLKECATCWADGSHLGRKPEHSLSLSTMTSWVWKRAENIKDRCNSLCVPLFDHSGLRIDQRSQVELSYYSRQLKLLTDLMKIVLTKCNHYIPEEVTTSLTTQYNSIKMASEYQEVLQWFLNVGLLPEATTNRKGRNSYLETSYDSRPPLVPYAYKVLRNFYTSQRMKFKKINSGLLSPRTQSCRILYIDSFIEHECNSNVLREHWLESGGNGLYPPPSLQAMLRVLLVPDVSIESKYALFVYFFLDLNMALENENSRYAEVIQNFLKFPSVFKITSSAIKTIQAFWNLDHGQFDTALEEIVSPFLHDHKLNQWQKELLIEALLVHHASKLALRALQAPGPPISSLLELKTLLANDMVAEAFHLQRSKSDPDLFRQFLTGCLCLGKMCALLDLALTEDEDRILEEFLRESKTAKTENLHFVHLLQRSKYIEAIQQLDELSRSKMNQQSVDLETPSLVLAAYNTTMTPATKRLSEVYYGIRNRLRANAPEAQKMNTLSSQLLRYNANDVLDGVYHSSIMSVDEATNYFDEELQRERKRLLYPGNVAFIRRPQLEAFTGYQGEGTISYPEVYRGAQKRRLNVSDEIDKEVEDDLNQNPKKRQKINDSLSGMKTAEPINATLLTRFKSRQKDKPNVTDQTIVSNTTQSRYEKDSSINCLNTPIVKSSQQVIESRDDSMSDTSELSKLDRIGTPQSILKVRNASGVPSSPLKKAVESTPRRSVSPRELESNEYMDEEKSIRFDLPSGNVTGNSSLQTSHESLDMSQRVPSTSMASVSVEEKDYASKIKKRLAGPSPRKSLRSSDVSLISASSTEEFFSPMHSHNNSPQKKMTTNSSDKESESDSEVNVTQIVRHFEEQQEDDEDEKPKRHEGPKPRRPLPRASRSRSKTPDIPSSPVRMSTRLLERSKTQFTEFYQTESTTKTIRQQPSGKSLERFVLESNAKKVSSLIPLQSSEEMFEKGKILAQSTEITESYAYTTEIMRTESDKMADMSTLPATQHTDFTMHRTTSSGLNETSQMALGKTEIVEETEDDDLPTTAEVTRSDVSGDEDLVSPPKDRTTKNQRQIGGRKSYKTIDDVCKEMSTNEETLLKSREKTPDLSTSLFVSQKGRETTTEPSISQAEIKEQEDTQNNITEVLSGQIQNPFEADKTNKEQADVLEIVEEMDYEISEIPEDNTKGTEVTKMFEEQIETDEEEEEENGSEKESHESDDEIEEVVIEDDDSSSSRIHDEKTKSSQGDSDSTDDESKSSAVICISSSDDTTESSSSSSSSTGNDDSLTSSPNTAKESTKSEDTESDRDDEQLLYGDLDVPTVPLRSQSISSTETEVFIPSSSTDVEMVPCNEEQLESEENTNKNDNHTFETKATETITFTSSSIVITASDLGHVTESGMSLNALTGEYEKVEDDDVFAIKGQPVATSTQVVHIETESVGDVVEETTSNSNNKEIDSSSVMSYNPKESQVCRKPGTDTVDKAEDSKDDDEMKTETSNTLKEKETDAAKSEIVDKKLTDPADRFAEQKSNITNESDEAETIIPDTQKSELQENETPIQPSEKVAADPLPDIEIKTTASKVPEIDIIADVADSRKKEKSSESDEAKKSPSKAGSKSRSQSTEDIHLKLSDNESNKEGDENQEDDKQNLKTPVKKSFEIESATDSGRILRSTRRRSISIDATTSEVVNPIVESPSITKKASRATSLPREEPVETPTRSKLRRRSNSTDNPATPTRVLTRRRSTLLDRIEEDNILDSPRRSTKKRAPTETDKSEDLKTPSSMVKRTRKASTASVEVPETVSTRKRGVLSEENTPTPQRVSRRLSMTKDTPMESPMEDNENVKAKVKLEKREVTPYRKTMSHDGSDSDASEILEGTAEDKLKVKSESRKLFPKATTSKQSSVEISDMDTSPEKDEENAPYATSRRLTRTQQSVLEKSASIAKKIESVPKKIPRRRGSKVDESPSKRGDISETESIVSTQSKHSATSVETRRVTRSSANQKTDEDDAVSVASSSRSKKSTAGNKKAKAVSSKDKNLDAIVEEDQENTKKMESIDDMDMDDDMASTHSAASKETTKKKGQGKKNEKK